MSDPENLVEVPEGDRECSTCAAVKPLHNYHRDRSRPEGRSLRCKACVARKRRESAEMERIVRQAVAEMAERRAARAAEALAAYRGPEPVEVNVGFTRYPFPRS